MQDDITGIVVGNELGRTRSVSYNNLEFVLRLNTRDASMCNHYEIQVMRCFHPEWVHIRYYRKEEDKMHLYAGTKEQVEKQGVHPVLTVRRNGNKYMPVIQVDGQEHLSISMPDGNLPAYIRVMRSTLWSEMVED